MSNNDIQKALEDIHEITSEIFKINANQECTGCIHKQKDDEDYSKECTLCSRFYDDNYEVKGNE